ncbi:hypothetical protein RI367_006270 [Sorochytrium milnesiophthora]
MSNIVQSTVRKGPSRFAPKLGGRPGQPGSGGQPKKPQAPSAPAVLTPPQSQAPQLEPASQQPAKVEAVDAEPVTAPSLVTKVPVIELSTKIPTSKRPLPPAPASPALSDVSSVLSDVVSELDLPPITDAGTVKAPRAKTSRKRKQADASNKPTKARGTAARKSKITAVVVDMSDESVRAVQPMKLYCSDEATLNGEQSTSFELAQLQRSRQITIQQERRRRLKDRQKQLVKLGTDEAAKAKFRRDWHEKDQALRREESAVLSANLTVRQISTTAPTSSSSSSNAHGDEGEREKEEVMKMTDEEDEDDDAASGPKVQYINGELVIDEASLTIHELPSKRRAADAQMAVVEEQNNRYFNQGTWMKSRNRTLRWQADEIDLFYKGLSAWGTNFELIARMIPGKTRVNVRNKYNQELKRHSARVEAALRNKASMDICQFSEASGIPLAEFSKPLPKDVVAILNLTPPASSEGNTTPPKHKEDDDEEEEEVMRMSDEEEEEDSGDTVVAPSKPPVPTPGDGKEEEEEEVMRMSDASDEE